MLSAIDNERISSRKNSLLLMVCANVNVSALENGKTVVKIGQINTRFLSDVWL